MNVYDAEKMATVLQPLNFHQVADPNAADLIIVNTCAIREKAEQKVFSYLGRLRRLKQRKPNLLIAVGGCVAQQEGRRIFRRVPYVDIVFGTQVVERLGELVQRVEQSHVRVIDIAETDEIAEMNSTVSPAVTNQISRFVTVMQGCDNFCSYCVVPYVRGREKSRHPNHIVNEIKNLVASGVSEVTLLGQNVNSYGIKEGLGSFVELLTRINAIKDLARIRFTTSHPKDLSPSLIKAFGTLEKLCKHIHLPIQSGSDRVLAQMNRGYTADTYLNLVDRLRAHCPDIAITTDIIVGFPGETPTDFKKTIDLVEKIQYDGLFAFKYSDRPNAKAAHFDGKITESVKSERLKQLLALQDTVTTRKNNALVGTVQEVLIEGLSRKVPAIHQCPTPSGINGQWNGRTTTNKIVNIDQNGRRNLRHADLTGALVHVKIERALAHSLWGKEIEMGPIQIRPKGDRTYAA